MNNQIERINEALKQAGVSSEDIQEWIQYYNQSRIDNIWQGLQFIHLPMRMAGIINQPHYLAPQLGTYMNDDPLQRKIMQLVIELDAITPTIEKFNN
jgi:hypothetical protein